MPKQKNCIMLFTKYPQQGRVKTRLARDIGGARATMLYRSMVDDTIGLLGALKIDTLVFFTPRSQKTAFRKWLGREYAYVPQKGKGLGQRMRNAFMHVFSKGYHQAVILGSDCPSVTGALIHKAFQKLAHNDIIIGPAYDGGYYLLGCTKSSFDPHIFRGIAWSSGSVFKDTMKYLGAQNKTVFVLPPARDIDTREDLECLYADAQRTGKETKTRTWLKNNAHLPEWKMKGKQREDTV